jgi:hypothetical protein
MHNSPRTVSEALLRTNLNELSHLLASELAMSCKKIAIYSPDHPVGQKALEKPFLLLARYFQFRSAVTIAIQRANLFISNIALKDAVYHSQIIQPMQMNDITVLLFDEHLSMKEFGVFMERFVKRVKQDDPNYHFMNFFARRNIKTVEVNTTRAFKLFEEQRQYRGEVDDDYSVRRFALDQMGTDPAHLAILTEIPDSGLIEQGIDFHPNLIRYLMPERIASLPHREFRRDLEQLSNVISGQPEGDATREQNVKKFVSLLKLAELHPDSAQILKQISTFNLTSPSTTKDAPVDPKSSTGKIKTQAVSQIETLLEEYCTPGNQSFEITPFTDAFERLLKTGLKDKANSILGRLTDLLSDSNPGRRQQALNLISRAIDQLNFQTDYHLFEELVKRVVVQLTARRETFEYSELIWRMCDRAIRERKFSLMAEISASMASRRYYDGNVTVYDSMAVKKAFESLNRSEIIDRLIKETINADHETGNQLKRIMVSIGSEEIAFALSQIVAHPLRQVRQQALRILAEMGKASLIVFSRIVNDDNWFERDMGRQELPDNHWYLIRNSIFVLGTLRDPEAVAPLRLRISDNDIRVRREIVTALEKIGGEEAVDLLLLMAEDATHEIRESAVAGIGVIGTAEVVPMLTDLLNRNSSEALKVISVLGKLGGEDARAYLSRILNSEDDLTTISAGRHAKDDLRLAVVKALGAIGDRAAINQIREYRDSLSAAQKFLFKNSPLQRTISEILSKS